MDIKYEHSKFLIERFDHYYDTVNNKGAFYIGINTFILGGICVTYLTLYDKVNRGLCFCDWCLFAVLLGCCIGSTLFTICAITPYSKGSTAPNSSQSLIFFGTIAARDAQGFENSFIAQTETNIQADMIHQVHVLANGLNSKFQKLRWASYLLIVQYCIIVPGLIIILTKLSAK